MFDLHFAVTHYFFAFPFSIRQGRRNEVFEQTELACIGKCDFLRIAKFSKILKYILYRILKKKKCLEIVQMCQQEPLVGH
jgi:hypothetical protein